MKSDLNLPAPAFIVSSGRCGSSLISNVLNTNPQVLSLSEFFRMLSDLGARWAQCMPEGEMSGTQFASLLCTPALRQNLLLQHGLHMEESLYQPAAGKAFLPGQGVPPILMTSLPHLSSEHDALFADICQFLQAQESASAAQHYARFFDWMRLRFGRKLWVERSGGSLRMVPSLFKAFPQARFIHLVRDGRNCAISMSQHFGYRMLMLGMQLRHEFGFDPFAPDAPAITQFVPEKWQGLLPQDFNADAFRAFQVPLAHCGQFWANEMRTGLRALEAIPRNQLLTLRYEASLNAPEQALARLAFFLDKDIVTVDWIRKAAIKIRSPRSSWTNLDARGRAELAEAVKPGVVALGDLYR